MLLFGMVKIKNCESCGVEIEGWANINKKFCCQRCYINYWRRKNKNRVREYSFHRKFSDQTIKELDRYIKKTEPIIKILGCSIEDFKKHIESKFVSGMNWENHNAKGWHIDHIRPCASFNLINPEHQRQCFHYTNLQPLWWNENIAKSDKWVAMPKRKEKFQSVNKNLS